MPHSRRLTMTAPVLLCVTFLAETISVAKAESVEFNRDVRPILKQHCAACHGGVKAAGGVSFVYKESVMKAAESGAIPVVAGKPDDSEMIRRIHADDAERMPPVDHGNALSDADKAILQTWIEQGANWDELWSMTPPQQSSTPEHDGDWGIKPIDAFVVHAMAQNGLQPNPPASNAEWLRRVTFDLTGLPPTIEEYQLFADEAGNDVSLAKQNVVDRLLASSAYGERWATVWLDLARYSDTYGFEKDPNRTIWPWRDWVVRAFNADMRYDDFTRKQIAGDLLPNATADDVLATAFHRNTQNNTEGGTDDEEWRMAAAIDRVNTIWTTWNSTTFGCVRCHDHPYDPYLQSEYYEFLALWNNAEDCDQNDDYPWVKYVYDRQQANVAEDLDRQLIAARTNANRIGQEISMLADWRVANIQSLSSTAGELHASENGGVKATGTLPVGVVYKIELTDVSGIAAVRFTLHRDDPLSDLPERPQVISDLTARARMLDGTEQDVKIDFIIADHLAGPYNPNDTLLPGSTGFGPYPVIEEERWCVAVLQDKLPEDCVTLQLNIVQSVAGNSGFQATPLRNFSLAVSDDSRWSYEWSSPSAVKAREEVRRVSNEVAAAPAHALVPVLRERPFNARRITRIQVRGNRLSLGAEMTPGVPNILGMDHPIRSRLDYADWLVRPEHPLTGRTIVNRLWAEMFGRGLVESLEDFGTSGTEPSHPQLLDRLAWDFTHDMEWSMKKFLKEVALSATYGQASSVDAAKLAADPTNVWLARGPRQRLTAEMIRDQGLAVSGLLSGELFGPPVFPPQPDGIWSSVYNSQSWETSTGNNRYRRALYTFQKRTSGYPGYLTFDAPTREACSARRLPTNTPLQALVTLNDPAFMEMAKVFAKAAWDGHGSPKSAITQMCQRLMLESPSDAIVERLTQLYGDACLEFEQNSDGNVSAVAETKELFGLTVVANALLNLDRFLVR